MYVYVYIYYQHILVPFRPHHFMSVPSVSFHQVIAQTLVARTPKWPKTLTSAQPFWMVSWDSCGGVDLGLVVFFFFHVDLGLIYGLTVQRYRLYF